MRTNTRTYLILLFAALFLSATARVGLAQDEKQPVEAAAYTEAEDAGDILSALEAEGNYTVLVEALVTTGIAEKLATTEAFTLFAPTDEAFGKLPEGKWEAMTAEEKASVLRHHLVMESIPAEKAVAMETVALTDGGEMVISQSEGETKVGDATVVAPDIMGTNGIAHGIDAVLMPEVKAKKTEDQ